VKMNDFLKIMTNNKLRSSLKNPVEANGAVKGKAPRAAKDRAPPPSVPEASALDGAAKLRPCPICGKPAAVETRPFCSKRCADIDLHRWLGGTYAIPAEDKDIDQQDLDQNDPE